MSLIVVGGGAAGLFAACRYAELKPGERVLVLEREAEALGKMRRATLENGGLTIATDDVKWLAERYPRGQQELLGMFTRFAARDAIAWFRAHDLPLRILEDRRVVPESGSFADFADAFLAKAAELVVTVRTGASVLEAARQTEGFRVWTKDGPAEEARFLLVATGGQGGGRGWGIAQEFGHTVVPPVPSILSLNCKDPRIRNLHGVTVPGAIAMLPEFDLRGEGGVEVTPKGLGGPAIAEITAWAARSLAEHDYTVLLRVNWIADYAEGQPTRVLERMQIEFPKRGVGDEPLFNLPGRLWERLLKAAKLKPKARWNSLQPRQLQTLAGQLVRSEFKVTGRGMNKTEWTTSGGIDCADVDPQTLQSQKQPGFFLAGETLNLDGPPGGYNHQIAWTTGALAAQAMAAEA